MKYKFTPDEAQSIADKFQKYYKQRKFSVSVEKLLSKASPMKTTLIAEKNGLVLLLEAQKNPSLSNSLVDLARWLSSQRIYSELSIVTDEDANFKGNFLIDIENEGIGLMIIDEDQKVNQIKKPRNFALIVTPEPTLSFGKYKSDVSECIFRFNNGDRKDGLKDLCELAENLTDILIDRAYDKGHLVSTLNIDRMDWSSKIDALASPRQYNPGFVPLISDTFKTDLHSFRNARNLFHHPPRNKGEDVRRQKQYAERMMMGPRIISELISISRKVK